VVIDTSSITGDRYQSVSKETEINSIRLRWRSIRVSELNNVGFTVFAYLLMKETH